MFRIIFCACSKNADIEELVQIVQDFCCKWPDSDADPLCLLFALEAYEVMRANTLTYEF